VGLLVPNLRGEERNARVVAALVAGGAALTVAVLFPGSTWSIILATLVGATVGVMLR